MSRLVPFTNGLPILCDLGEARVGKDMHNGDIMPDIYRAPEVILGMNWATKVDIWAVGVTFLAVQGSALNTLETAMLAWKSPLENMTILEAILDMCDSHAPISIASCSSMLLCLR